VSTPEVAGAGVGGNRVPGVAAPRPMRSDTVRPIEVRGRSSRPVTGVDSPWWVSPGPGQGGLPELHPQFKPSVEQVEGP